MEPRMPIHKEKEVWTPELERNYGSPASVIILQMKENETQKKVKLLD